MKGKTFPSWMCHDWSHRMKHLKVSHHNQNGKAIKPHPTGYFEAASAHVAYLGFVCLHFTH